jgi:hypothetical protein
MKRNRIVINLDSPRPPRARGRVGKVLLIIGVVLILIAGGLGVGGYFWWRNFQTGPSYSLARMVDAVQRNDNATVDSMLDTDKISADFVAQVREKTAGSSLATSLWPSQADAVNAAVSAKLKETIHDQLLTELRDLTDVAKGKPLFLIALGIPYFADVTRQDNTASATVKIKNEVIKINMQSADNRWRIVAVQDEKLAKMVADAVVKSLPTSGANLQNEIKNQLEKLK